MPTRSDAERLDILKQTRDAVDDALLASADNADVISYMTPVGNRSVQRNRLRAIEEQADREKSIQQLEMRVNGAASNRLVLRRRP